MRILIQDLRFGLRMLFKNPGFTVIVILTLAIGIGANTAIFSVVNAVLFQPLPYRESGRIMTVLHNGRNPVAGGDFLDWRKQQQSFEILAAAQAWGGTLTGTDKPETLSGLSMGEGLFELLGVSPLLGRTFLPDDYEPGKENVLVLSHALWQRQFGSDPNILGHTVTLDHKNYTIIGVMPQGFRFAPFWVTQAEMWAPLSLLGRETNRGDNSLRVFGKLKDGVSLAQAQAEMNAICKRLEEAYPDSNSGRTVIVDPLLEKVVGSVKHPLYVLLGVVGFVLLIACVNVANISIARNAKRQKEITVRMALGAGSHRVLRQLLTESILLSLIAGAFSLIPAVWGIDLFKALCLSAGTSFEGKMPRLQDVAIDFSVLMFTLFIALLTGIVFGLLPAWRASCMNLSDPLKETGRSLTEGKISRRLRNALVVAEVSLSLVLLVGSGLLLRSFLQIQSIDPGFNPQNVLTMTVSVAGSNQYTGERRKSLYRSLFQEIGAIPGIRSISAINHLPLHGDLWGMSIFAEGRPVPIPAERDYAVYRVCFPNYFQTMEIPLLKGRDFTDLDMQGSPSVAIVNETLAQRYWPNEDPIGKRIAFRSMEGTPAWLTVVGVSKNVQEHDWAADLANEVYLPFLQQEDYLNDTRSHVAYMTLVIRTTVPPQSVAAIVQNTVWSMDKNIPVSSVTTLDRVVKNSYWQQRFNAILIGLFAVVALILAAVGIYGVVSYTVAQRTHEIGIRIALGAERSHILRLMIRQGMLSVFLGIAIGLFTALALSRVVTGLLYGISATDWVAFGLTPFILAAVALAACTIPAWRATNIEPITALRWE